jgi:hypothetical protein
MVARGDGSVALFLAVNEMKKLICIKVPYSLFLKEYYNALVGYTYARKSVPDHRGQFWHRQSHSAGIGPDGGNSGHGLP